MRGPISQLRRRMVTLKMRCPAAIFEELMANLKEGDGPTWDVTSGKIIPTKTSSSSSTFQYPHLSNYEPHNEVGTHSEKLIVHYEPFWAHNQL